MEENAEFNGSNNETEMDFQLISASSTTNENSEMSNSPADTSPIAGELEKETESEQTEIEEDCANPDNTEDGSIVIETAETTEIVVENITSSSEELTSNKELVVEEPITPEKTPRKRRITELAEDEDQDQEFTWEEYMEETGSIAVAPTAFFHVEYSLESGIKIKMVLEVPNREVEGEYWQASVVMICGPLLTLRYLGYDEDRTSDFWWDISTLEAHPVGWSLQNEKLLKPPKGVLKLHPNWEPLLSHKMEAIPAYLLEAGNGSIPIDQILTGMHVEVQEENNPLNVWFATVIENVGGRLLLRHLGVESNSQDFWLFYLSYRIHPYGWANLNKCTCNPPLDIKNLHTDEEWNDLKNINDVKTLSPDLLQPQEIIEEHNFKVGMKLEALHPVSRLHINPATVQKIIDNRFFIVEIDEYPNEKTDPPIIVCCHAASQCIFPVNWAKENGEKIQFPKGFTDNPDNKEFDWEIYLESCKAEAAPKELFIENYINSGFEINNKLEAVNPSNPYQICAATVTNILEPLIWIQLDYMDMTSANHIVTLNSQDIFPVGWCESNHYPIKAPRVSFSKRQRKTLRKFSMSPNRKKLDGNLPMKENSKSWCSKIYFNHRCYSGPLLSKTRLAQLPQHIGPGPVTLVMREVLSSLINVAYKSSRVLKELQLRGKPNANMKEEVLKAKWKGKSYRACVEVVTKCEQVEDFCRKICKQFDCCSLLFGPLHIEGMCPEHCHLKNKTKYSSGSVVRKRKKCKTLGPQNNPANKAAAAKKSPENTDDKKDLNETRNIEVTVIKTEPGETKEDNGEPKRKYKPFILPKTSMITRGAKIPNYSLEMKWRRSRVRKLIGTEAPVKRKVGRPNGSGSKVDDQPKPVAKKTDKTKKPDRKNNTNKIPKIHLVTNPIKWSVDEVVSYVKSTECAPMARVLRDEEVDGQAFLLMTLPVVQEYLHLKFVPAVKLCHLIEGIKLAFYKQYANVTG